MPLETKEISLDLNHTKWSQILKQYQTKDGLIKYKQLKQDTSNDQSHLFKIYLNELTSLSYKNFKLLDQKSQMAFLINAYNAFTIELILQNYPIKSIKKIGGFFSGPWQKEFLSLLDGQIKSLDAIEHVWLRPKYKDYRIHAAVNCASISCPPLRDEAFIGDQLEVQLEDQMTNWLKDQSLNQIDFKTQNFRISKIFDWYKSDFEDWGQGVFKVVLKHGPKAPPDSKVNPSNVKSSYSPYIRISFLSYNWDLNEAP